MPVFDDHLSVHAVVLHLLSVSVTCQTLDFLLHVTTALHSLAVHNDYKATLITCCLQAFLHAWPFRPA